MSSALGIDLSQEPPVGALITFSSDTHAIGGGASSTTTGSPIIKTFELSSDGLDPALREQITHANVIVASAPSNGGLSVQVSLPFDDTKKVGALINQELEDLLPFEPSGFAVGFARAPYRQPSSSTTASDSESGFKYQVALSPREVVADSLTALSRFGIDPQLLTTRSTAVLPLARASLALAHQHSQNDSLPHAEKSCVMIVWQISEREADIVVRSGTRVIAVQTVTAVATELGESLAQGLIVAARKLELSASHPISDIIIVEEPRSTDASASSSTTGQATYNPHLGTATILVSEVNKLISATRATHPPAAHSSTPIAVSAVPIEQLVPELASIPGFARGIPSARASFLALIGASVSGLYRPPHNSAASNPSTSAPSLLAAIPHADDFGGVALGSVLTNFRRGEFAYRPPLGEITRAAKSLTRPALTALGCIVAAFLMLYLFRAHQIHRLESAIASAVHAVAPTLASDPGRELAALSDEAGRMEAELKDIGLSDRSSPLELYAELTKHFPMLPDTTVDRMSIRGSRIEVRGCAPSYRTIEQIENALTKVKVFAQVKKGSAQGCSGAAAGARGFTFEITARE